MLSVLVHLVQKHTKQEKHRKSHIVFAKQKNKRKSRHISAEDVKNSVCAYAQKEKKHRKTVHKAQKYGIISTEKRNITEMQDNIKSNYEKVKDYEQKTNYSNDC